MGHALPFPELAATMRELRSMQAGRLRHWENICTKAAERGEVPAFDLSGMRQQLVRLYQVETILIALAPREAEVRALAPELMRAPTEPPA